VPPKNICIVDDDSAVRESLRMVLERAGYEVRCYASARIFLSQADMAQCGCLLVNQFMPEMTGIALLELLKTRAVRCCALLVTGGNVAELAPYALAAGAMAVLEKPLGGKELFAWIERAMSSTAPGHT